MGDGTAPHMGFTCCLLHPRKVKPPKASPGLAGLSPSLGKQTPSPSLPACVVAAIRSRHELQAQA
uniref:Uncharacterized protein n=1 Tax=Setaria viridis TaxID=4556 RepID=A0A4U6VMI4_SETVI|nr:hypothetical protein SEVIR_3G130301v2 [Setaria viridis]